MTKGFSHIMEQLYAMKNEDNIAGMKRFGIVPTNGLGVPMPSLRKMAKEVGKDHELSLQLWSSGVHDARILACLIDDPKKVSEQQMDEWVREFYSWDLCDQCCFSLFDRTPYAYDKAEEWSGDGQEYVRRAAFSLMAGLAIHDKRRADEAFLKFFPIIEEASTDDRNFVKKAVSWALRQIGKRSLPLNKEAIACARRIPRIDSKSARWIGSDALRELEGEKVKERLAKRAG